MSTDPELDRRIQEQLRQPPTPTGIPSVMQVWGRCGNCPECGAPIWFMAAAPATDRAPAAYYSCACAELHARRSLVELKKFKAEQGEPNGERQA
jgi:hypothetical protein